MTTETIHLPDSAADVRAHHNWAPLALLRIALRVTEHVLREALYDCPEQQRSVALIIRSKAEELRFLLDAYELALANVSVTNDNIPF